MSYEHLPRRNWNFEIVSVPGNPGNPEILSYFLQESGLVALYVTVEEDSEEDDHALGDKLEMGVQGHEVEAVIEDANDEGAHKGAPDGATATHEAGPAL